MIFSLLLRITEVPLKEIITASLYPLRYLVYLLLPLTLTPLLSESPRLTFFYIRSLILTFIIICTAGLLQLAIFPNLQFLEYAGYDPHFFRVVSTWLDPNFLGAGLVFAIILTLALPHKIITPTQKAITLGLCTLTLILTFSRSAYIMAMLAVLIFATLQRSWKIFAGLILALTLTYAIYAFPRTQLDASRNIDRAFSANLRLKSYFQAYTLFLQNPITGIGYNLTRYEKNKNLMVLDMQQGGNSGGGVDSSWLLIIATTGAIGFIAFLSFWVRLAYFIIDNTAQTHSKKHFESLKIFLYKAAPIDHAAVSLLVAWSIHSWFINSLFYAYLLILWSITFSLTQVLHLDTTESKL